MFRQQASRLKHRSEKICGGQSVRPGNAASDNAALIHRRGSVCFLVCKLIFVEINLQAKHGAVLFLSDINLDLLILNGYVLSDNLKDLLSFLE